MGTPPVLSAIRLTPAPSELAASGLVGWVSLVIDGVLFVDSVALRRTRNGRHTLSWPCRRDRAGREHAIVAPVDEAARRRLEEHVFSELGLGAGGRP